MMHTPTTHETYRNPERLPRPRHRLAPAGASLVFFVVATAWLASCANPVAPTGGPPDQEPPVLEETFPASGEVNVSTSVARLTFSEDVDQASFVRALSVTPAFEGRLTFDWKGRSVEVRFPDSLRQNTTYILSLDNNLRDVHNVALSQPITLAFSTGPVINQGRLAGQVVDVRQRKGMAGFDVFAYAAPDSVPPSPLPEHPDYRTQTDDQGQFQFAYLNEQPYYVVALQDRNRNRQPDALEPYAVPPRAVLLADTTTTDAPRWLVTVQDSLPPQVQRIRSLSDRRLALLFSEPVRLLSRATDAWQLRDSLRQQPAPIEGVYTLPGETREVYLFTQPLRAVPYELRPAGIADSSGNQIAPEIHRFTPSAEADTLGLRFLGFVPPPGPPSTQAPAPLAPGRAPGVQLNQPVDEARLRTFVNLADTTGQALTFAVETDNGTTYRLAPTPAPPPGQVVEVVVDGSKLGGADTLFTGRFQPLPASELGELSGVVLPPDSTEDSTNAPIILNLFAAGDGPVRRIRAEASGHFLMDQLPAGQYHLEAFIDHNKNERWDGGNLSPYVPVEPLLWREDSLRVRARWETAMEDTLRFSDW